MSQFYSDLITWAAVGCAGAAMFLISTDGDVAPSGASDVALIAPAATAEPLNIRDLAEEPERAMARAAVLDLDDIPEAELRDVSFNAFAETAALVPLDPLRDSGKVTGESVNLRGGPGTGYAIVGRAVRDDDLLVTGNQDGNWIEVLLPITEDPAWIHGNFFAAPQTLARN